jgi:PAS domain S-box-containing protein
MNDNDDSGLPQAADLRREAEKRLRTRESHPAEPIAEASARALVHELQVHQIELEMQNEELQRAQAAAVEASEKYHDLFDFAPVGYFLWDQEGRILEVNLAGAALLGLDRGAVVQKRLRQFVAMEDRVAFVEFCQRVLAAEGKQTCEVKLPHNGQVVYALVKGIAARDKQGQRVLCRAAVIDITRQKRADELARTHEAEAKHRAAQLRGLVSELSQTEQRERRRLAQALHDNLQQLLVTAKLKLDGLRSLARDEGLGAAAGQVDELLEQCLTESRAITVQLSPPVLYDAGLLPGLEWLARQMWQEHDLVVEVEADGQAEPADESIRVLLFQAVRELLNNIVQHARVKLARIKMARLDEKVEITVCDEGVGFDPADPANVSAFGLFGIRERLELLGGKLEVKSLSGKGTSVSMVAPIASSLPLVDFGIAVREKQAAQGATVANDQPRSADGKSIRVLLADDHPVLRRGLADLLRQRPEIEVVGEARDGQEAVDLTQQNNPDVVLMDVTMPRMDGIAATRHIKAHLPEVRVIALSMHEEKDMAVAMREAGAIDYVPKGAPAETLIEAILRHSGSRSGEPPL